MREVSDFDLFFTFHTRIGLFLLSQHLRCSISLQYILHNQSKVGSGAVLTLPFLLFLYYEGKTVGKLYPSKYWVLPSLLL